MDQEPIVKPPAAVAEKLLQLHRFLESERLRRRVSDEAYAFGMGRWRDLREAADGWRRPIADLLSEIEGVGTAVRAMPTPPPPTPLPALPPDEVDGAEVLALLRGILVGSVEFAMAGPPARWTDIHHGEGEIHADGWILHLYRRGEGFRHVERIEAPDGRTSDLERMLAREGSPSDLLEDDEFARLGRILDRLEADPAATRTSLLRAHAAGDAWGVRRAADAWLTLKGAPEAATAELRLDALGAGGTGGLDAADLEFAWDLDDILGRHPLPKAPSP